MNRTFNIPRQHIDDFCRRWRVTELTKKRTDPELEGVDIGLFVRFDPSAEWSLTDRMKMENEFQTISGHSVRLRNRHHSHTSSRASMMVLYDA